MRNTRGTGQYYEFTDENLMPADFNDDFLNNDRNKTSLNDFLSRKIMEYDFGSTDVFVTIGNNVLSNREREKGAQITELRYGCKHEEADIKIIIHVMNCLRNGYERLLVRTGDTDVVTLLLAHWHLFESTSQIQVDFGFGKSRRQYDINRISEKISSEKLLGLIFFYTFSGCDVTSSFYYISKIGWWNLWETHDFVTKTFIKLSWTPECVDEEDFQILETFVCKAYNPQNRFKTNNINKLRQLLFMSSSENKLRMIPPSIDSLRQHVLRSAFAGGWLWGSAFTRDVTMPSPTHWGWRMNTERDFVPIWCSTAEISLPSITFTCKCKSICKRCKCAVNGEQCLPYCKCSCNFEGQ